MSKEKDRANFSKLVKAYYRKHLKPDKFIPGKTKIHYAGRVFDTQELTSMVYAVLDSWITLGAYGKELEEKLRNYMNAKNCILANSGSSANLLSTSALKSQKLSRPLKEGDEVITPALTFPTTFAPIVQAGFKPILVDCNISTLNIDEQKIQQAISKKTRAMVIPHTLGNPCNMELISKICKKHRLYLIEDVCDSLGAKFDRKRLGSFGHMGTLSFYPAHHITMGEGGAVIINDESFSKAVLSLRDWGRDCFCKGDSSLAGDCGRRFDYRIKLSDRSISYDHRYIYSHIGYNLKPTDIQAALGLAQFNKLNDFIRMRNRNFRRLFDGLKVFEDKFILSTWHKKSQPSWFAFPITLKSNCGFSRQELLRFLENNCIETRLIFAGNIIRQPAYSKCNFRISGNLKNSDIVMEKSFFIGVYPGLNKQKIDYIISVFRKFFKNKRK
ncbi:MAG: lipopolysaccharide biosynthesis protein RfbH [Candidatus Omnitrophica bacterium]|nr:lipopolysaccharide biosynthesis protein RfbH [Candidatus Omnitrophota bacterium]